MDQDSDTVAFWRSLPRETLEVPKVTDLRRAAKSFKWRTGTSVDGLSPRACPLLADDALAMAVYLVWAAEQRGRWPNAATRVHVMLLSKPTGGFRHIALLPSIYRLRAKLRAAHIRRWAVEHARP